MPKNAPEKPAKVGLSAEQDQGGTEGPSDIPGPQNGAQHSKDSSQDNGESFDRTYVESLRSEAKENRLKAQRADWLETEVRRLATREAVRGVLTDPESLPWSDDFTDTETGLPDQDKIRAAAEQLVKAQPWLARPRGDVGQGRHSETSETLSLSALLRS